jgi:hypothetical protein
MNLVKWTPYLERRTQAVVYGEPHCSTSAVIDREALSEFINRTESPGPCQFLKLPLEIRYFIYEMLLTTPYCTQIASTGCGLEFKLHT